MYARQVNRTISLRRALVSVSDKTDLGRLARLLVDTKVEVLSTGGTAKALAELGVAVVKVSEYTGAPEILGGRVKTLHPKIHGGILAKSSADHEAELSRHGIPPIDLVVVNLYPFREAIAKPGCTLAEAVEQIDIGGPTMVRAAAKNWERVVVVVDPSDYAAVAECVANEGGVSEAVRRRLARKAFAHTAAYDAAIAEYLSRFDEHGAAIPEDALPAFLLVGGNSAGEQLRYGENPHQAAAFYPQRAVGEPPGLGDATVLQGKALSFNNLLDADAAVGLVRELAALGPAAAVIKHATPCGAAIGAAEESLASVVERALAADVESAFGGIVALSRTCDVATAERLAALFLEVVIAPAVTDEARAVFARKPNLRVLELALGASVGDAPIRVRSIAGGILAQRDDRMGTTPARAEHVAGPAPTAAIATALELAWRVVKHVRSNAIAITDARTTLGLGGGQTSRVEAVRQALARAGARAQRAVLASDAFFPFRDSIDTLAKAGIAAIVQPGGSVRDAEVVAAANEHGITMMFTHERHFKH